MARPTGTTMGSLRPGNCLRICAEWFRKPPAASRIRAQWKAWQALCLSASCGAPQRTATRKAMWATVSPIECRLFDLSDCAPLLVGEMIAQLRFLPEGRVRIRVFCLFLTLAALVGSVRAQVFDLEREHVPMSELKGFWRFHTGDDPDGKLG